MRNVPALTSARRSRFVAQTTRTSTAMSSSGHRRDGTVAAPRRREAAAGARPAARRFRPRKAFHRPRARTRRCAGGGAGERASLVPEQLAGHQRGRQRRAVHGHERARRPLAHLVNGAGHQLFSGTRLAHQQGRHGSTRHSLDARHQAPHHRCSSAQLVQAVSGDELRRWSRLRRKPSAWSVPTAAPSRAGSRLARCALRRLACHWWSRDRPAECLRRRAPAPGGNGKPSGLPR